jgi:plasmid rolling circle replication initiator protein Rep
MTEQVESTCPSYVYLSELSPKDKPWDKHGSEAEVVSGLYKQGIYDKLGDRINGCSEHLEFKNTLDLETGESRYKLRKAYFCRVRHCPKCQWRRQQMWRARFFQAFPQIITDYPDARFVFLTLTVRNCRVEDLRENLCLMNKAWQRLTQRRDFPALGCLKSTEVTRSTLGMAHPHFHAILMVNPEYFSQGYLSHTKWVEFWKDCLRVDYGASVRVKAVKGKLGQTDDVDNEVLEAIFETLKYSVKPDDLMVDKKWLEDITTQLRKTRFVSLTGVFKKYMSEKEPENLINEDESLDDEISGTSVYFKWKQKVQRYCKSSNQL